MFAEWSDPFDIDKYYDEVGNIFTKVSAYVDPTKTVSPTVVLPQQPSIIDSAPTKVGVVELPPPIAKSNFEVQPNTIFSDGHAVGRQPIYNILRSGPPSNVNQFKEPYLEPRHYPSYRSQEPQTLSYDMIQILNIILFIIMFMMIISIMQLTKTIHKQHRCIINMLMYLKK
jgi:hypothetical protein